jgi:phosphoglycerate dehydrogenase-like enzyme
MKILLASRIDFAAVEQLRSRHDVATAYGAQEPELREAIADREVLVFRSGVAISASVMEAAPALKLLVRAGAGLDNVDLEYVARRGLLFQNVPGPGARAVAEMTFALMLALARNVLPADRLLRAGRFAKHEMTGHLLRGKVLGIVGAGNIGSEVGRMGAAWGMRPVGCVAHVFPAKVERLARSAIRCAPFEEVLGLADFLSIHVPLSDTTRGLVDAAALARMKRGAFLVNLARGGVVDENALRAVLEEGRLAGAALDVHAAEGDGAVSPLADLDNVVLTPHIGAGTLDSQCEIGEIVVRTIETFSDEMEGADCCADVEQVA